MKKIWKRSRYGKPLIPESLGTGESKIRTIGNQCTETVRVTEEEDGMQISVWNRTYHLSEKSLLFDSIVSAGEELLAAPMRLCARYNGTELVPGKAVLLQMQREENDRCTVLSTCETSRVVLNLSCTVEEDGCGDATVTVMPRGLSVAQVFGLETMQEEVFGIDSLVLEIPFRKEMAKFYHIFPFGGMIGEKTTLENNSLTFAGKVPTGGFHTGFKEQIYLGNERAGMGVFFESDEGWLNRDPERVVEVLETDESVLLRVHLWDEEPEEWRAHKADPKLAIDLFPKKFRFGFQVTPVKEYPKRNFYERNFHLDCFKKTPGNYEDYLSGNIPEGSGESGFDRLKRLGVQVLYIHEKWNNIQNSPFLTVESDRRLRYIVEQCHARGIRVIPYFGYEISTLSPIWAEHGAKFALQEGELPACGWYRYPYQRDLCVCMQSEWSELFYDGLTKIYEEYGIDGFYFDTLVSPLACKNTAHGCGYQHSDGTVHVTYPTRRIRQFMQKIYAFTKQHGGTVNVHGFGRFNLSALPFCDSLWEGESFQTLLLRGDLKQMPQDLLQAQYTGFDTGVPTYSLCYSNPPVWTFRSAMVMALLHGSIPKPVDIGEPLELMSKLWDALDAFPLEEAERHLYCAPSSRVFADHPEAKVTTYETESTVLAVCASASADFDAEVEFRFDLPVLFDAMTGEKLSDNGVFRRRLAGFDFVLVRAERK